MPLWQAKRGGQPAQPAVPADRCAPEIVGFLTGFGGALAAAERQPVGPQRQSRIFSAAISILVVRDIFVAMADLTTVQKMCSKL
jgi:hypothetical protein